MDMDFLGDDSALQAILGEYNCCALRSGAAFQPPGWDFPEPTARRVRGKGRVQSVELGSFLQSGHVVALLWKTFGPAAADCLTHSKQSDALCKSALTTALGENVQERASVRPLIVAGTVPEPVLDSSMWKSEPGGHGPRLSGAAGSDFHMFRACSDVTLTDGFWCNV